MDEEESVNPNGSRRQIGNNNNNEIYRRRLKYIETAAAVDSLFTEESNRSASGRMENSTKTIFKDESSRKVTGNVERNLKTESTERNSIFNYCRSVLKPRSDANRSVRCDICKGDFLLYRQSGHAHCSMAIEHAQSHMDRSVYSCRQCVFVSKKVYGIRKHVAMAHGTPAESNVDDYYEDKTDVYADEIKRLITMCYGKANKLSSNGSKAVVQQSQSRMAPMAKSFFAHRRRSFPHNNDELPEIRLDHCWRLIRNGTKRDGIMQCRKCGHNVRCSPLRSEAARQLRRHIYQAHLSVPIARCLLCRMEFTEFDKVSKHFTECHEGKSCGGNYKNNENQFHDEIMRELSACFDSSKDAGNVGRNTNGIISKSGTSLQSKPPAQIGQWNHGAQLAKSTVGASPLSRHEIHRCPKCDQSFGNPLVLKTHMEVFHSVSSRSSGSKAPIDNAHRSANVVSKPFTFRSSGNPLLATPLTNGTHHRNPSSVVSSRITTTTIAASASNIPSFWHGLFHMPLFFHFSTTFKSVSGPANLLKHELPARINVAGRISPNVVYEYLAQVRKTGGKDIIVFRMTQPPLSDENRPQWDGLLADMVEKEKCCVLETKKTPWIKDFYVLPLLANEKVNEVLLPFHDGPGLEMPPKDTILCLVVRHRERQHETSASAQVPQRLPSLDGKSALSTSSPAMKTAANDSSATAISRNKKPMESQSKLGGDAQSVGVGPTTTSIAPISVVDNPLLSPPKLKTLLDEIEQAQNPIEWIGNIMNSIGMEMTTTTDGSPMVKPVSSKADEDPMLRGSMAAASMNREKPKESNVAQPVTNIAMESEVNKYGKQNANKCVSMVQNCLPRQQSNDATPPSTMRAGWQRMTPYTPRKTLISSTPYLAVWPPADHRAPPFMAALTSTDGCSEAAQLLASLSPPRTTPKRKATGEEGQRKHGRLSDTAAQSKSTDGNNGDQDIGGATSLIHRCTKCDEEFGYGFMLKIHMEVFH